MQSSVLLTIGGEKFPARLQYDLAPGSCAFLETLLPYRGKLIHARWSGESVWSPLRTVWPHKFTVPPENATAAAVPGQVLLFGGEHSEPELLIAYGLTRFACKAGPLAGNPVLMIEDRLARLVELGTRMQWRGAAELQIERVSHRSCIDPLRDQIEEQSGLLQTGDVEHADR